VVLDSSGDEAARYSAQTVPLSDIIDARGNLLGYRVDRTDWSSPSVLRGILALVGD